MNTNNPKPIGEASLSVLFDLAEKKAAEIPDLESYDQWQERMAMTFDVTPPHLKTETGRRRAYVENVAAKLKWRADQEALNRGNREMMGSVFDTFRGSR